MTPSNRNRMLTKEEVEEIRGGFGPSRDEIVSVKLPFDEFSRLCATALALYAVAEAAENSCCEDPCYGNCRVSIDEALDALREGKR